MYANKCENIILVCLFTWLSRASSKTVSLIFAVNSENFCVVSHDRELV